MKGYIADVLFTYYGLMQMVDFFQFRFHHFVALLPMTDIVPTELGVINDSNNEDRKHGACHILHYLFHRKDILTPRGNKGCLEDMKFATFPSTF
jgi:hypothetical protein